MDLLTIFAFSIVLNMAMFIPAYLFKTDKLTDISYAVTFAAVAVFGYLSGVQSGYQLLLFLMVAAWAIRLGGFLLYRVTKKGKDARFDGKREDIKWFAKFWFLQGLTVPVVMLAASMVLFGDFTEIKLLSLVGLGVFLAGLALEAVADWKKWVFNLQPSNKGKWIDEGVWSWSRHPNYLGEMAVWIGIYLYALPALDSWQYLVGLISPIYIIILLSYGSGIPILEKYADEKWGKNPQYQDYKKRVGVLLPKI